MSRQRGDTEAPLAKMNIGTKLPERLETLLNGPDGVDPKTGAIRLLKAPFDSLLAPLRLQPKDIGIQEDTTALTDGMLRKIVSLTTGRIFQIDLRSDPPVLSGRKPIRTFHESPSIPVFVITEDGPGLLVLNPSAPELLTQENIPSGLAALMKQKWEEKGSILPNAAAASKVRAVAPVAAAVATTKNAEPAPKTLPRKPFKSLAELRAAAAAPKTLPPIADNAEPMPVAPPPQVAPEVPVEKAKPIPLPPITETPGYNGISRIIPPAPNPFSIPPPRRPSTPPPEAEPEENEGDYENEFENVNDSDPNADAEAEASE